MSSNPCVACYLEANMIIGIALITIFISSILMGSITGVYVHDLLRKTKIKEKYIPFIVTFVLAYLLITMVILIKVVIALQSKGFTILGLY